MRARLAEDAVAAVGRTVEKERLTGPLLPVPVESAQAARAARESTLAAERKRIDAFMVCTPWSS
jgi:hypothetical protein